MAPRSAGANFGLCDGKNFEPFTRENLKPGIRGIPDRDGYRYYYDINGNIDLGSLACSGGSANIEIAVATKEYCDTLDHDKGRMAELIEVRTFVKSCGDANYTIDLQELATGAGFPKPIRCISCHEEPYPPWDPKVNYFK